MKISLLSTSLVETDPTVSATSTRHNSFSEDDMDDSLASLNSMGNGASPLIGGMSALSVSGSSTGSSGGFHMHSPHVCISTFGEGRGEGDRRKWTWAIPWPISTL